MSDIQVAAGADLPGFDRYVPQDRVDAYAEASGDHNPIHLDEEYASKTPFGTRIAHGMLSLAFVTELLAKSFPDDWHAGGKIKVRFSAPVIPGETVSIYGSISGVTETNEGTVVTCNVGCKKPDGTDAVSGKATVPLRQG